MWYAYAEISCEGFVLLACTKARYLFPWILFGIFKYTVHMGPEEWVIGLGYHRIKIEWLWEQLKKKRTLRI